MVLKRAVRRAPFLVSLLPLVILWEFVGQQELTRFLPPLSAIAQQMWTFAVDGVLWDDLRFTLVTITAGFAVALPLGVVTGLLIGLSRVLDNSLGFLVEIFQSAPAAALVPIVVLLLGVGRLAMIAIVVVFSYFVVALSTAAGVKGVDRRLLDMATTFGASGFTKIRRVVLPGSTPLMLTGFRLGVGRAFSGGVLAEMLITLEGLGGRMMFYGGSFRLDALFALLLVILVVAYVAMGLVQMLERFVLKWRA
jgi:NitT/TauT family transport system permease protein